MSVPLSSHLGQGKGVSDVDLLFSHVMNAKHKHRSLYWGDISPVTVDVPDCTIRNRNQFHLPGVSAVVDQSCHQGDGDFNLLVNFLQISQFRV